MVLDRQNNDRTYVLCYTHDLSEYAQLLAIEVSRGACTAPIASRTDPTGLKICRSGHDAVCACKRHPDLHNVVGTARDIVRFSCSQHLVVKHETFYPHVSPGSSMDSSLGWL